MGAPKKRVPQRKRFIRGTDIQVKRVQTVTGGRSRFVWATDKGHQIPKHDTELR